VSESPTRTGVDTLHERRLWLWSAAFLLFVVGDVVTTVVGLRSGYAAEVGPLVAPLVRRYGHVAMVGLKLLTLGLCGGLYRAAPVPHRVGVPLGLAVLGGLVSGWNLVVVAAVYG
jgi:Zn-dependent protease